ncbi:glycosyltransferase family 4 protein [Peribacillus frigoritolerans]|uniref:glycosyltransferase family 4 protein n=1 Tax=Peribacillus frigoritolerans TaxID=450367 RepID=UPI0024BF4653|nr:glycosyltransferase family 4 protein [Peribacillus frigoritolerans]WHY12585.1 glycosyltransferase family 4 protein [Peribacillus frigoritolerans]
MKILFLTQFFSPETGAASKRVYGLARQLVKLGHEVHVVTGMPNYPSGRIKDEYKKKIFCFEKIDGINVSRYYVYVSKKRNTLNRMLNYFSLVLSSLFFLLKRREIDIIITSSPPLFLGLTGVIMSKIKKIPHVFDIRDIWPEVAVEIGELKEGSKVYKIMKRIEKIIYKNSDILTVVTKGKKTNLIKNGVEANKIKLVSNGFDEEFLEIPINKDIAERYNLIGKFNFLYAGIIGIAQGIDIIIESAEKLKFNNEIQFVLVGNGVELERMKNLVREKKLSNVIFTGEQPHNNIRSFLHYSNVALVPLKSEALKDSVPTKLYEALGAGRPVILSASGDSVEVVKESRGGLVVKPGDIDSFVKAIEKLYKDKDFYEDCTINSKEYVIKNYSRTAIAKTLEKQLKLELDKSRDNSKNL